MKPDTKNSSNSQAVTRRHFLTTTSASALSLTLLKPTTIFGAEANSKVNIGLIGCGGRGTWIANLFVKNGGYNFVAVADYFQDRVNAAGESLHVPAEHRYTGLSGYQRLLEQQLDAVVIESPPYFHPEHAAAGIAAGKHVYLAKPIAVDVPGCQRVEQAGKLATEKKLCFLVDFQTRANPLYQEIVRLIREGRIGSIVSAEAAYQTGPVGDGVDQARRADPKNPELRLRSWVTDKVLSGDIITEQNIHALDMASWMLDAAPLSAEGTGGKRREFVGDCWDHFALLFQYPNNVTLTFSSKQVGYGFDDIMCRVYGTTGTADAHYAAHSKLLSKDEVKEGNVPDLYQSGAEANIATFHGNILKGDCANATVSASVRSNLTTILGRTAAYQRRRVTWEEMMRRKEALVADLNGLKA
jgi:predicted dehydrogenase